MAGTERARRGDEIALGDPQCRRASHPRKGRNTEDAEGEGDVEDRLTEIGSDGQRKHQRRKGQQHVDPADHQGLEAAAEVTRQHPQAATDYNAQQWR